MKAISLCLLALMLAMVQVVMLAACDAPLTFLAGESQGYGLQAVSWSGTNAQASSAAYRSARTQAELDALWRDAGPQGDAATKPSLPSGKMAVAVFLGQRFEPDLKVEITRTLIERGRIGEPPRAIVVWREVKPQNDMPQTGTANTPAATDGTGIDTGSAASSPWAIRLMDASVLPPVFRQEN